MNYSPLELVFKLGASKLKPQNLTHPRELPSSFDFNKKTVLLIDDNAGIVSFLEDDLEIIFEEHHINLEKFNILSFVGEHAVYEFLSLIREYADLNIEYAILDITIGGSLVTDFGNVKLTGMDVFDVIYKINPEVKYFFYTGNLIKDPISTIDKVISKYKLIANKNLEDKILYKTEVQMDLRREYIYKILFEDTEEK